MSKKISLEEGTVLISRTDSIGDVLLTLPMCASLKRDYPKIKIVFLASAYTFPVLKRCTAIDEILDVNELLGQPSVNQVQTLSSLNIDVFIHVFPNRVLASLAKKAKIPHRIGTSHRSFHLLTCNHRVNFTRRKSTDHEAQLNFHLLSPLGYSVLPSFESLNENLTYFSGAKQQFASEFRSEKRKIILHPKSQGSAVEWPIEKYSDLANRLIAENCTVFFTGTEKEGQDFRKNISFSTEIRDTSGQFSLDELISFIDEADVLVACSTGPLHIAGSLNKPCIGLFTPKKPMHPGRWQPLGKNSITIAAHESCNCPSKVKCACVQGISVDVVYAKIMKLLNV